MLAPGLRLGFLTERACEMIGDTKPGDTDLRLPKKRQPVIALPVVSS
jgi:hypothetical protein